jgi:uncharacterized protein YegP (UPF0339 family)
MNPHPAWRGQRRVRIALEIGARSVRVVGLLPLDGPTIQRPILEGTHVAQVTIGGTLAVIHSFDDPRLIRGVSRPKEAGHSYDRTDRAIVHIDVPIPAEGLKGEIAIRIVDLSKVQARPTDPDGVRRLLDTSSRKLRNVANITAAQLVAHPDWTSLGLPGSPEVPASGCYEIYFDQRRKFRWRLRLPDGRVIAISSNSYDKRAECEADLRWIKERGAAAPVRSLDLTQQPHPRAPGKSRHKGPTTKRR